MEILEENKVTENTFKKITAENFLNLGSKMDIQIHESYSTLSG